MYDEPILLKDQYKEHNIYLPLTQKIIYHVLASENVNSIRNH
jgi:hypothetical protein